VQIKSDPPMRFGRSPRRPSTSRFARARSHSPWAQATGSLQSRGMPRGWHPEPNHVAVRN